jgi:hypothetical protein
MPASKLNYLVVYNNHSQVYGCSSEKVAIESPPPEGLTEEDKNVFFVTFEPDTNNISLYKTEDKKEEK